MPALLWVAVRAPVGGALRLQPFFSPATFFRPLLGPLSGSAGALALAGALLTIAGVWLWRRQLRRRWYGVALGSLLLLAAPYLISSLGRGITPPAGGVSVPLWLGWHFAILLSSTALIVPTAALFRGSDAENAPVAWIAGGVVIALAATTIGVLVWSPRGGWPDWYTFLWTPALFLVAMPAPRWATISGIALVAGSAAALVTWGAELSGQIQVAERDIARLGDEPDPLAVPLLERFAEQVMDAPAPASGTEMYALWRGSALGDQGYPSQLALWTSNGSLIEELALDSLDLPLSLLSTMVRELDPDESQRVAQVARVPGVHYVLMVRLGEDEVLTAGIGPRSQLVMPGRVGRLLAAGPNRVAVVPAHALTAGRIVRRASPAALAPRGLGSAQRVSPGVARRSPCGARCGGPSGSGPAARAGGAGRAPRRGRAGLPLVAGRAGLRWSSAPAPVEKSVALLSHPARGHARLFLHRPGGRLRGVELRSPDRRGRSGAGICSSLRRSGMRPSRRADHCGWRTTRWKSGCAS